MKEKLSFVNFYRHPRFYRHLIPWIIAIVLLVLLASIDDESGERSNFTPPLELVVFTFEIFLLVYSSFYIYSQFWRKGRKMNFWLVQVAIILLLAGADAYLENGAVQMGALPSFWANTLFLCLLLLVAYGFKWAYHGARSILVIERLKAKQTETELNLLKSQINPHFLFNTLNNIYSTNLHDHEKANEIILELSDLLRYQLESNKKAKVPLSSEIESLDNYIELEKIRVKECDIEIKRSGDLSRAEILPLLLLPFVENAFKYGTGITKGKIDILYQLEGHNLFTFKCVNKIVTSAEKLHSGGIGLANVRKRLELMYENKYSLNIANENGNFSVDLQMQL